jgi:hypothetical protein
MSPAPAVASAGAVRERPGGSAPPTVPAVDERDRSHDRRDDQNELDRLALSALMRVYPVGAGVRFGGHLPVLSSRWWRKLAATAPWGLRAGDALAVVGYGATVGVPEALLVRRVTDGQQALVFPPELAPPVGEGGSDESLREAV